MGCIFSKNNKTNLTIRNISHKPLSFYRPPPITIYPQHINIYLKR